MASQQSNQQLTSGDNSLLPVLLPTPPQSQQQPPNQSNALQQSLSTPTPLMASRTHPMLGPSTAASGGSAALHPPPAAVRLPPAPTMGKLGLPPQRPALPTPTAIAASSSEVFHSNPTPASSSSPLFSAGSIIDGSDSGNRGGGAAGAAASPYSPKSLTSFVSAAQFSGGGGLPPTYPPPITRPSPTQHFVPPALSAASVEVPASGGGVRGMGSATSSGSLPHYSTHRNNPLSPVASHSSYASGVVNGSTVTIRSNSSIHQFNSPASPSAGVLQHGHAIAMGGGGAVPVGGERPRRHRGGAESTSLAAGGVTLGGKGISTLKLAFMAIGALVVIFNLALFSRYVFVGGDGGPSATSQQQQQQGHDTAPNGGEQAPPAKVKGGGGDAPPPAVFGDDKRFRDANAAKSVQKLVPYTFDSRAWEGMESMDDIIRTKIPKRHWGPSEDAIISSDSYKDHARFVEATGCDLLSVPFNPASDDKCIAYMLNRDNWKELRPLPMEFDQRTVKFEIVFKPVGNGITTQLATMIKVPQRMFPYESFSEVAAFHADRIFKINRVPPTTILWLPLSQIQVALDTYGHQMTAVEEFLKESQVSTYREWVEKDFINYTAKMKWQQVDETTNLLSVPISMQLRIADVGHMLDTALSIPYKSHNTSWHRFFDLIGQRDPLPEGEEPIVLADGEEAISGHVAQRYEQLLRRRPIFMKERFVGSIVHISELATFDMVIGNDDRSPNKNNFVVGGCRDKYGGGCADVPVLNALKHPGPPTYVHLDQGMAFYNTPKRSALFSSIRDVAEEDKPPTFCMFRTPQINRMRELAALSVANEAPIDDGRGHVTPDANVDDKRLRTLFHKLMSRRLPPIVKLYVDSQTLRGCSRRLHRVIRLFDKCMAYDEIRPFVLAP